MSAGHNSINAEALTSFIERVERLAKDKDDIAADTKEVFDEAKGSGFDTKIMRRIIALPEDGQG